VLRPAGLDPHGGGGGEPERVGGGGSWAVRGGAAACGGCSAEIAPKVRLGRDFRVCPGSRRKMLAGTDPETPLDRRRLSEFLAEPKNSHGACSVTGPRPERRHPSLGSQSTPTSVVVAGRSVAATRAPGVRWALRAPCDWVNGPAFTQSPAPDMPESAGELAGERAVPYPWRPARAPVARRQLLAAPQMWAASTTGSTTSASLRDRVSGPP
jgi:hypothetical protein